MIITEIQYFFSKIIRFQAIFKDTVEFTCALEFKISSQHNITFFQITVFYVPAVSRRIQLPALLSAVSEHLSSWNTDFLFRDLLFRKSSTGGLSAVAGSAALDVHMLRHTLIITIINALYRLTVDTDGMAWMRQRITERLSSLSLLRKALAAGAVTITGMLTSHHDVSLAAQTVLVIGTIFHNTF